MIFTNINKKEADARRFHVGMRNLKTALSVLACMLIYHITGRDGIFLAAVSAIICLQESVEKSIESGKNRMIGTALGALMGMVFLYINLFFERVDLSLPLATAGVVVYIAMCNVLEKNDTIVIGLVVFLAIVLQQTDTAPFLYSMNRLVDTAIGILVSIIINRFIRRPEPPKDALLPCELDGQISFGDMPVSHIKNSDQTK